MKNKHLDDTEIQEYVLQKANCDINIIEHIQHCASCKIHAEQYRLLFDGIKEQEKPGFDFNLAELVMEQLPEPRQKVSGEHSFSYLMVFLAIFFASIVFYFFGNNLLNLLGGIPTNVNWLNNYYGCKPAGIPLH